MDNPYNDQVVEMLKAVMDSSVTAEDKDKLEYLESVILMAHRISLVILAQN